MKRAHLNRKVSQKYLDWAEMLPPVERGPIAVLQELRKQQRCDSEKTYNDTRPPDGTSIRFSYFRLFELYHIEDFEQLHNNLISLFPQLRVDIFHENFSQEFWRLAEGTHWGSGWFKQAAIIRDSNFRRRLAGYDLLIELPTLPSEVAYIDVTLHKIMSSVLVITLDVHLNDAATEKLQRIQNKQHLSNVTLAQIIPWQLSSAGYVKDSSARTMTNEISGWVEQLKLDIENSLKKYFVGYFLKRPFRLPAHMPAVEVFVVRGTRKNHPTFDDWRKDASRWIESLGVDISIEAFGDEKIIFNLPRRSSWHQNDESMQRQIYRMVVFEEPFIQSIDMAGFGDDISNAITWHTGNRLNEMLPHLVFNQYLKATQENAQGLWEVVFRDRRWRRSLSSFFKLGSIISEEEELTDRLFMEFEQHSQYFENTKPLIQEFKYIGNRGGRLSQETLWEQIYEKKLGLVQRHRQRLSYLVKSFSFQLQARNMKEIHKLTKASYIVSLVAVVIAMISLAVTMKSLPSNWQGVKEIRSTLCKLLWP